MKSTFIVLFVGVVTLLGAVGAAPVVAQENATVTTEQPIHQYEHYQPVDSNLAVIDYEYTDGTFRIDFQNDGPPTRVTLTEAVQFSEGAGKGSIVRQSLQSGRDTATIQVDPVNGEAAVTIVTTESLRNQEFIWVSTGQTEDPRPPIGWQGAQGLVAITALLSAALTFRWVRKKYDEQDQGAKRLA